ncbi:MAG: 4'-phosphopantetheinyl transferase superfamily protein [Rikenellaceae bacterium]
MGAKCFLATIEKGSDTSELEAKFLTQSDRDYIATLGAQKRVREVSLWRALLRKTLSENSFAEHIYKADIIYNEVGAPYFDNVKDLYFSVSHSRSIVAVVVDCERACAIDVEEVDRDFQSVASRFATDAEVKLCAELPLIWAAKECAYKFSGRNQLDFTKDIRVTAIDTTEKRIDIQIQKMEVDTNPHLYSFYYSFTKQPNHIIVASSAILAPL